ncbi:MAG: biotin/lipoyl-binding protein, partial [Solirubrobacterales bacterium]|nr:biotin/lipoyl-binding protein [Solirubrobacterales bacterium]
MVEISTDKVDVEVPSPVAGTVAKRYFEEGDTVTVGAVLADVQPDDGAAPTEPDAPSAGGDDEAPASGGETIDIVTPGAGESITEGTLLEWTVAVGDEVAADDTVCEISTDKVDVELPAPAAGTIAELLAEEGDTVQVGQVIARMTTGAGGNTPAGGSASA